MIFLLLSVAVFLDTVLKIDHASVIDPSCIFKYLDAPIYRKPSLNNFVQGNSFLFPTLKEQFLME